MVGTTSLWPSLLATWLSLAPVPSSSGTGARPPAPTTPPPAITLPVRREANRAAWD